MEENLNGRLGHLTTEQEEALSEFKKQLSAEGFYEEKKHDDYLVLRFLRARQFKLPAAKEMWIKSETWRKENGVDTILEDFDFPEYAEVRKLYPRLYHKTDKLGRPIYIERVGIVDVKQLWKVTTSERMLRNHTYEYEKLIKYRFKACSAKSGRVFEQSTTILDLAGVNLSTFSSVVGLVREVSGMGQNYYPELLGKMYIINSPMLFTAIWSVIKQMLDEVTVKKIEIVGSNYKSRLLESISPENIPDFLGGECKCPGGCSNNDIGPWNDGTCPGYPIPEMEKFLVKYGQGLGDWGSK